jgi:uncharacterized metal-binding protein YceD (DUF177 family)
MKPLKEYIIPFVGLKIGNHHFDYQINDKFFSFFEYDEFAQVNVQVDLDFDKKSTFFELNFNVSGSVEVCCDITNEPYRQELKDTFKLVVNFGDELNDEDDEILILPHGDYEIDISHYIYEFIILSVPIKRVHPGVEDGTLKSEILDKLEELSPKGESTKGLNEVKDKETDPIWDKLKNLLTDK